MVRSQVKLQPKLSQRRIPLRHGPLFSLAVSIFFVLAGAAFLPRLGIENDEALFATAFYLPANSEQYIVHLGHSRLPLMLIHYLGTLKSWIYRPLLHFWGTSVEAMRLPVLLVGAATLWLFYLLLRRVAGERAALIGCGLLSVDAMYLLTICFDWGPVALQHLLILGGALSLVRFWQDRNEPALALGFFLFGLALWDKAIAIWVLSGLGVAALLTIPRQIFDRVTFRRVAVAVLALAFGALPLIVYNLRSDMGTLKGTAAFDSSNLRSKARALERGLSGSLLFGWLTPENWQTQNPHAPRSRLELASAAVAERSGHPRHSLVLYAFFAALLLAPLARGAALRAILLATVAMIVAWCQMAFTAGAGGGAHHILLLWPLPQAVIGISFSAASQRLGRAGVPLLATTLAVLLASGLAVMNEYYAQVVRNGGAVAWTDAVFPLSSYLEKVPAQELFCLDWGYLDTLRVLSNGRLPLRVGSVQISKQTLAPEDSRALDQMISQPDHLFLAHTREFEFYPGLSARLTQYAEAAGYRREILSIISDSYGRPTFEISRFHALPQNHL